MRRLAVGHQILKPDGRRMEIVSVVHTEGLRIIWWRQITDPLAEVAA